VGRYRNIVIRFGIEKLERWGLTEGKKSLTMFSRLDIIAYWRVTDRHTDERTSWHGTVRAMLTHRAVKWQKNCSKLVGPRVDCYSYWARVVYM